VFWFTNGLGSDDSDCFADIDEFASRHRTAVAHCTETDFAIAGNDGANFYFANSSANHRINDAIAKI